MAKIQQKTVVDQVMNYIKQQISEGLYKPGDKIPTEQELAQELGVGRSSIREAVKIFNYLGVMESMSARGTFVCERSKISSEALTWALLLGNDELDEVVEMRGAIELWSFIRMTMQYNSNPQEITPHIDSIEKQLKKMEKSFTEEDPLEMVEADYEFHRAIIKGGNNPLFLELFDVLKSFMYTEINESQKTYTDRSKIIAEHKTLLEAIKSGDIITAEKTNIATINNYKHFLHNEK